MHAGACRHAVLLNPAIAAARGGGCHQYAFSQLRELESTKFVYLRDRTFVPPCSFTREQLPCGTRRSSATLISIDIRNTPVYKSRSLVITRCNNFKIRLQPSQSCARERYGIFRKGSQYREESARWITAPHGCHGKIGSRSDPRTILDFA